MVKSRIQNATRVPGQTPKYNWAFPALATVAREEGFGALYSGFAPKVLRLAPGGGVLLLVVEMLESASESVRPGVFAAFTKTDPALMASQRCGGKD